MFNWKKIVGGLFEKGANTISNIKDSISPKLEVDNNLVTEDDILQAIDDLPYTPEVVELEPVSEETRILNEELDSANLVKVEMVGIWANFEYLHKPEMHGLGSIKIDERLYYTVPVGWTYDDDVEIQYWYITFPIDGTEEDIIEFFSNIKIDEISFPGVS